MKPIADDMVVFAAVVEAGSFSQAAKVVGLSKQAVSDRIAKLEDYLGVRLIERTTRQLRLTSLGARYLEHSRRITDAMLAGQKELHSLRDRPSGTLRISTPTLYGRRFLTPIVSELLVRYPDLCVEVLLSNRYDDLVADKVDVAIRVGIPKDSNLIGRKLGSSDVHLVASPSFLSRMGAPSPQTLRQFPCVGMRTTETWTIGSANNTIKPVFVVNDLEMGLDATLAGVGIARLPSFLIRPHVTQGSLVVLFDGAPLANRPIYVVYASREHRSPSLSAFLERLEAHFQPMLPLNRSGS